MRQNPIETPETAAAPAEIVALSTLAIGCFGLTAPFSGFHPAVSGGGLVDVPEPAGRLAAAAGALGRSAAGLFGR